MSGLLRRLGAQAPDSCRTSRVAGGLVGCGRRKLHPALRLHTSSMQPCVSCNSCCGAAALPAQAQEAVSAVAQREKELEREVEEATREVSSYSDEDWVPSGLALSC